MGTQPPVCWLRKWVSIRMDWRKLRYVVLLSHCPGRSPLVSCFMENPEFHNSIFFTVVENVLSSEDFVVYHSDVQHPMSVFALPWKPQILLVLRTSSHCLRYFIVFVDVRILLTCRRPICKLFYACLEPLTFYLKFHRKLLSAASTAVFVFVWECGCR